MIALTILLALICPECKELKQKSTVTVGAQTTTLMAIRQYYDEEGNFHYEDPNIHSTTYHCSEGHIFNERELETKPSLLNGNDAREVTTKGD